MVRCAPRVSCTFVPLKLNLYTLGPSGESFLIGSDAGKPVRCVRELDIFINAGVIMSTQISKTVASCFAAVRQICSIQRSVSRSFCCLSLRHFCCYVWIIGEQPLRAAFPNTCWIVDPPRLLHYVRPRVSIVSKVTLAVCSASVRQIPTGRTDVSLSAQHGS